MTEADQPSWADIEDDDEPDVTTAHPDVGITVLLNGEKFSAPEEFAELNMYARSPLLTYLYSTISFDPIV